MTPGRIPCAEALGAPKGWLVAGPCSHDPCGVAVKVLTRADVAEIIRNGESSGVEFKRDSIDNRGLAKELVALSNFEGGLVLLGVDDDGSVSGISRPNLEEWVMTACRDKIRPEIIPYFQVIKDVVPGKDLAVVKVDPCYTVHQVWHDQHRTYYIRAGTQSREASTEELARLLAQRGSLRAETRPVAGTSLADLDLRRLADYFGRVRQQEVPPREDRAAWTRLLINTEILEGEVAEAACTLAGLVLFGRDPSRHLPQAKVDAVAFPGPDPDYAAIERATLRGPLVGLFRAGDGRLELEESGLVEQTLAFVARNAGVEARLEGGIRIERQAYPPDVVREAIVNALVHRDYLLSATDVFVSLFSDMLEIVSPGRLPNGITVERMRAGCRSARNELIKDVMRDYGYLEHLGMGVPRKLIRGMRQHNDTEPDLIAGEEQFTVQLWRTPKGRA